MNYFAKRLSSFNGTDLKGLRLSSTEFRNQVAFQTQRENCISSRGGIGDWTEQQWDWSETLPLWRCALERTWAIPINLPFDNLWRMRWKSTLRSIYHTLIDWLEIPRLRGWSAKLFPISQPMFTNEKITISFLWFAFPKTIWPLLDSLDNGFIFLFSSQSLHADSSNLHYYTVFVISSIVNLNGN